MTSMPDDADVYGVEVAKLQSGVTVDGDGVLYGTLHYVTDYAGFSSDSEEQKGNFVALRVTAPSDATVKYQSSTGKSGTFAPDDRLMVWRVANNEATLTITVERREETASITCKASGLTLEQATG